MCSAHAILAGPPRHLLSAVISVKIFDMSTGGGEDQMDGSWKEHDAQVAEKAAKEAEELREKVRLHFMTIAL